MKWPQCSPSTYLTAITYVAQKLVSPISWDYILSSLKKKRKKHTQKHQAGQLNKANDCAARNLSFCE